MKSQVCASKWVGYHYQWSDLLLKAEVFPEATNGGLEARVVLIVGT